MAKTTFTFPSSDQKTPVYCISWSPDTEEIKGILQIAHGMVEYIERYEAFAEFLNSQGYLVVGNDHLGHGESVLSPEEWGYFARENGSDILVEDMHKLRVMMQEKYPKVPYFILGHSMGSFLLRKYLCIHNDRLHGAVIMGTGFQPNGMVQAGKLLCKFLAGVHGWHYRSKLMQKIVLGGNDNKFRGESLKNSWLTRDVDVVRAYSRDPKCTFIFTLNGFYNLFDTIHYNNKHENLAQMSQELPMFFVAGEDDPVGAFGAGVKKVYQTYKALGMKDIVWKLYPDDRHEILNELDRTQVYGDICHWLEMHLIIK